MLDSTSLSALWAREPSSHSLHPSDWKRYPRRISLFSVSLISIPSVWLSQQYPENPFTSYVSHLLRNMPQLCSHIKSLLPPQISFNNFPNLAPCSLIPGQALPSHLTNQPSVPMLVCTWSLLLGMPFSSSTPSKSYNSSLQNLSLINILCMVSNKHHLGHTSIIFNYLMKDLDY